MRGIICTRCLALLRRSYRPPQSGSIHTILLPYAGSAQSRPQVLEENSQCI